MTIYYVDPAATGSNNGSDWTNAWTSLQSAADTAVAGDIVYCRGTENISAKIDFDTNAGTPADGFIKFIGCNASGVVDGTRFILNAGGTSGRHCIDASSGTADLIWMENIECKNSTSAAYGFYGGSGTLGWVFINCCANTCGSYGFMSFGLGSVLIRCVAYSNGNTGFYRSGTKMFFCASRDNSSRGFDCGVSSGIYIGCIAHGNTDAGFYGAHQGSVFFNCVSDGNGDDGIAIWSHTDLYFPLIIGCRITNHSGSGDIGVNANSEALVIGWSYFENNDGANIQNKAGAYGEIPLEGGSSTSIIEDQSNTNQGYIDPTNNDFSTDENASLRQIAITVPWS